ncbi:hypothetical protein JTE90_024727 [Oedothorax gibbosus]|uniref:Gag-like protein n=1 Tax=Oedothorax gibbosus TaxID=931172 RepID=A0AAV6UA30_9ARAC|nr:hypothetical protein JTE90_024727 [Oedothorax gibbosus]
MLFSDLQSLNSLEEALGRNVFRYQISVRRSCGNSRKPQIKICDVGDIESEVEMNKIVREIEAERNLPIETLGFAFKRSRDPKEKRCDWVLEVDPRQWVNVRTLKFIRFRWGRHAVFEFLDLNQCNRCFAFGHGGKKCNKKPLCRRCGRDHALMDCLVKESSCVNCRRSNAQRSTKYDSLHSVYSSRCCVLQQAKENQALKTEYA